ncbi:MAG TPA: UDPGP type 1 family protein [Gemmataceae bacterium]|jgi:UDP-N-acetylglucosamine/UDP-N-acetylgalactosamine diphosphorylase|nr:UDPGP type 1 family protein [Gemmataceae bacterium]
MQADLTSIREKLQKYDQAHLLAHWHGLDEEERQLLLAEIAALDLDVVRTLFQERDKVYEVPSEDRITPAPVLPESAGTSATRSRGENMLASGKVAVLVVAGGQGSRLGFEHPKGMFPIGPVTQRSLFQIHVEKVRALQNRYGGSIPFLVMTSPATDEETKQFFREHGYFGLPESDVHFFRQGTMPAVDLATGQLLMDAPHQLFASPDGHGGMLAALAGSGLLRRLLDRGIEALYYFQVDNPLVKIADPAFLGMHAENAAEISLKIVPKEDPLDKLGNLVLIDGRCSIIEYSDLPEALGAKRTPEGKLWIWAGSPAIHIFDMAFLERMTGQGVRIPFHIARKKVPYLDKEGRLVQPECENALKFERFIFDLLPLADRCLLVETSRRKEFMPLKNGSGSDSPETVRQALTNLYASWLEKAGMRVPRTEKGDVDIPVEISPLFALDADELKRRLPAGWSLQGSQVLLET